MFRGMLDRGLAPLIAFEGDSCGFTNEMAGNKMTDKDPGADESQSILGKTMSLRAFLFVAGQAIKQKVEFFICCTKAAPDPDHSGGDHRFNCGQRFDP